MKSILSHKQNDLIREYRPDYSYLFDDGYDGEDVGKRQEREDARFLARANKINQKDLRAFKKDFQKLDYWLSRNPGSYAEAVTMNAATYGDMVKTIAGESGAGMSNTLRVLLSEMKSANGQKDILNDLVTAGVDDFRHHSGFSNINDLLAGHFKRPEDTWIDYHNGTSGTTLIHTFGKEKAVFKVEHGNYEGGTAGMYLNETYIAPCENMDRGKELIDRTVKHFDKNQEASFENIETYLGTPVKPPQNTHEIDQIKKAGCIQGTCECANIVKEKDQKLAKKLLVEMGVSRETAKKFAHPDTYKELEKDLYAPKQDLQRSQGRSR